MTIWPGGGERVAFHADVLRDSSRDPAPQTSADLSGEKVDQSQQTFRSGKCTFLTLRHFPLDLISEKIRKVSVNSQAFVLEAHKLIEKNTSEVKCAERKSAFLQNNKV